MATHEHGVQEGSECEGMDGPVCYYAPTGLTTFKSDETCGNGGVDVMGSCAVHVNSSTSK
jgi:hypothetical protein